MWSASVQVLGEKNTVKFVASSGTVGVPRTIGGMKNNVTVPIPGNCQLTIQVSGIKNQILIDEKLRGHVSVVGGGMKCSVSWVNSDKQ